MAQPSRQSRREAELNAQFRAVEEGRAVVIPLPEDPDERVRMSATLVAQGFIGTEVGANLAGCRSIKDFLSAIGRLRLADVFTNEASVDQDLKAAHSL